MPRWRARLAPNTTNLAPYRKAVVYDSEREGVYLFLYLDWHDPICRADYWFETVEDAFEWAQDELRFPAEAWTTIGDPPERQHDFDQGETSP